MSRINSRQKGARGERELAHKLTENGYPARRGQQFSGSPESPDVVCEALAKFQIECKLVEALNIHKAIAQARNDAGEGQIPTVMHKKNRTEWLVTLPLDDFLELLKGHPDFPVEKKETRPYLTCPTCPTCGSLDIKNTGRQLLTDPPQTQMRCNHCQAYWGMR